MAEILYKLTNYSDLPCKSNVIWLTGNDMARLNEHLILAGQKPRNDDFIREMRDKGIARYCMLYHHGIPVARGAVEPYSNEIWEAADIRTVGAFRNKGFAKEILRFLSRYIIEHGKIATCPTEEDNFAMQNVIKSIGYEEMQR